MGVGFYISSRFPTSSHFGSRWNSVSRQVKAIRLTQHGIPLRGPKEMQCGATLGQSRATSSRVCPRDWRV